MSMFSTLCRFVSGAAGDVMNLFFPPACPLCGGPLSANEHFVCTSCRFGAPLTDFASEECNPMAERLRDMLPVKQAAALMWFVDGSDWQRIIHEFKYRSRPRFAYLMGEWLGGVLASGGLYADVEAVVFVPLHPLKRLARGYDQTEIIAEGVASSLGVPVIRGAVVRRVNNPSQALHHEQERWENVEGIFAVRRPEKLRGRHVLLVDDVFTTGATMVSCSSTILSSCEGVTLSIATLAVTQRDMAADR